MIRIDKLSKYYGSKRVLTDIDLHFVEGQVYGIVGENGAGKTTLFHCIAGLETYQGTIQTHPPDFKNHLGFLPTNPYFFEKITGREYLQLLCNARKIPAPNLDARNVFDLPLEQYASTYSTGMKKKLALLGTLLPENRCFILDEPFNGVDIQSNLVITEIIRQLKSLGKTILIASHIFSTLQETCDQIHVLREGRLEESVASPDFPMLEKKMRDFSIGDRISRLDLH